MDKVKVLVIDDSAVIRGIVIEVLSSDPDIEVVGEAENPYVARELIKSLNPDILTLDVEMPRMDGITFLSNLMRLRPMPVIMLSTLTTKGAEITLEALSLGAIDFIAKPTVQDLLSNKESFKGLIVDKIKQAVKVDQKQHNITHQLNSNNKAILPFAGVKRPNHIVAIGASTGGTEAIKAILKQLPKNCPPIVITQHIPPMFSERFASRLNEVCEIQVQEARHGQKIKSGNVYIAPGGIHLKVDSRNGTLFCILEDSDKVNRHKPSVDVLFDSLVPIASNTQAILLTGMGNDGAQGMLNLKNSGAYTIIQDEQSSLIWGMPGSAYQLDAHIDELPLADIASIMLHHASLTKDEIRAGYES